MLLSLLRRKDAQLPFTGFLLDLLREKFGNEDIPANPHAQVRAIKEVLRESLLRKRPGLKDCDYVLERMEELVNSSKDVPEKEGEEEGDPKHFAGYYLRWVRGLDYQQVCLYLARYDLKEGKRLYAEEDIKDVAALLSERAVYDFEVGRLGFEAALFGFGGSYGEGEGKGAPSGDSDAIDLTKLPDEEVINIFKTVF